MFVYFSRTRSPVWIPVKHEYRFKLDWFQVQSSERSGIDFTTSVCRDMVHKGLGVRFTNVLSSDCRATYILSVSKYWRNLQWRIQDFPDWRSLAHSSTFTCFKRVLTWVFGFLSARCDAPDPSLPFLYPLHYHGNRTTALYPGHLIFSKYPHKLPHFLGKKVQPVRLCDLV